MSYHNQIKTQKIVINLKMTKTQNFNENRKGSAISKNIIIFLFFFSCMKEKLECFVILKVESSLTVRERIESRKKI